MTSGRLIRPKQGAKNATARMPKAPAPPGLTAARALMEGDGTQVTPVSSRGKLGSEHRHFQIGGSLGAKLAAAGIANGCLQHNPTQGPGLDSRFCAPDWVFGVHRTVEFENRGRNPPNAKQIERHEQEIVKRAERMAPELGLIERARVYAVGLLADRLAADELPNTISNRETVYLNLLGEFFTQTYGVWRETRATDVVGGQKRAHDAAKALKRHAATLRMQADELDRQARYLLGDGEYDPAIEPPGPPVEVPRQLSGEWPRDLPPIDPTRGAGG